MRRIRENATWKDERLSRRHIQQQGGRPIQHSEDCRPLDCSYASAGAIDVDGLMGDCEDDRAIFSPGAAVETPLQIRGNDGGCSQQIKTAHGIECHQGEGQMPAVGEDCAENDENCSDGLRYRLKALQPRAVASPGMGVATRDKVLLSQCELDSHGAIIGFGSSDTGLIRVR